MYILSSSDQFSDDLKKGCGVEVIVHLVIIYIHMNMKIYGIIKDDKKVKYISL